MEVAVDHGDDLICLDTGLPEEFAQNFTSPTTDDGNGAALGGAAQRSVGRRGHRARRASSTRLPVSFNRRIAAKAFSRHEP